MQQPEAGAETIDGPVLVDGHVHVYPCYDVLVWLERAFANFQAAAASAGIHSRTPGVLLLVETDEQNYLRTWTSAPEVEIAKGWKALSTREDRSLLLCSGERRLVLIAGRQIRTRENLEVLAVGCNATFPTGLDLGAAVSAVRNANAVPIVPWGFGKWWGQRGRLVSELVEGANPPFFLGDNGGRTRTGPAPRQFAQARNNGIFTLAGSDPLPFQRQQVRAGSYGFVLNGKVDLDRPTESIHGLLGGLRAQPATFGRRAGRFEFVRNQLGMQIRKGIART